ncbi:MAG: pyrroline-5-carboxylate reductase family protein [Sphingomicrobium sp.]|nr:pyrroline-5-carboxylate reductase [Sphingomonadales bacterium]
MSGPAFPLPTWFIGAGNMAGAMIAGWRAAGVELGSCVAIRPSGQPVEGVRTVRSLVEAGREPHLVMLGFKPQMLGEVGPQLAPTLTRETIVVSLLAGTPAAALRARFPDVRAIVRAMPNLPVAVRRGVTALYAEDGDQAARDLVSELMTALGMAVWCPAEAQLSAIGALAGSGPAYVARFVDALAQAGAERGLDPALAKILALETVLGTGWLAATNQQPMDEIARRVASPKGTTLAGLAVLDAELPALVARTLNAAIARGEALAAEARSG